MIRKKKDSKFITIDLTGSQGNAFCLIALADKLSLRMGLDKEKIYKEMTSGDYENLVQTFDKYFGSFVILER
tara:strand:- start:585 stop:800 length:216 start_codon:yes stop_codon:yes gene_type:complete